MGLSTAASVPRRRQNWQGSEVTAGNIDDEQRAASKATGASIAFHRTRPEVTIERHSRSRQVELATSLEGRHAIYLDLRFWIYLRDAERSGDVGLHGILLGELRRVVATKAAFCPISDSTFLEVFKQTDEHTRALTVKLIDELSLGVTLIPFDLRVGTELAHLLHAAQTPDQVYPLHYLVWSKLSYVLGFVHPITKTFDRPTALAIQKAFFDHMWAIPLVEMNRHLGNKMSQDEPLHFEGAARRINEANRQHASSLKSFEQTYQAELVGVLALYAGRAADILCSMAPASVGPPPPHGSAQRREYEQQCLALLVAALKTDRGKNAMRSLYIHTCLHAAVRWDKKQQLEANDFFDFQHASAALGYCDALFTERGLRALVTRSDLGLDKRFDCFVTSKVDEAISYVQSIK